MMIAQVGDLCIVFRLEERTWLFKDWGHGNLRGERADVCDQWL